MERILVRMRSGLFLSVMCVAFLAVICTSVSGNSGIKAKAGKMNVLFFAVDDLRPQLGCYGHPEILSPNIDRLAKEGVIFTQAFCQQAVCSPSRTSLLTGARPDTTQVWDLETHFRDRIPDVVTLPQLFKDHGYRTQGIGKIYHGNLDDKVSWTVPWERDGPEAKNSPKALGSYYSPEGIEVLRKDTELQQERREAYMRSRNIRKLNAGQQRQFRPRGLPWEAPDVADEVLGDGRLAVRAVQLLNDIKQSGEAFFLAVGFRKPHLPFISPKRYWDLYDPTKIHLAPNPQAPKNAPPFALTNFGELRAYFGMPQEGPLSEAQAREAKHGYYASVSYTDAQIGRVIDELNRLGLRENTIIILWGDHGWKLGEHGGWCKHTNFENDTHVPLLISAPGIGKSGVKSDALVEFVDIYPTLAELCGLPLPKHLEGSSFVPQLKNSGAAGKTAVFSQYPRSHEGMKLMGYSMRTDRFRYTEWRKVGSKEVVARELYDHQKDPQENINVAGESSYRSDLATLEALMNGGWRRQQQQAEKLRGR